ncbi:hypothetical protein Ocin01_11215 [Orchesella cincta]|uniref:Transmembrane protein n=1 Tax=Orchesella cincta TaxID=48709 RepID=A0A1D2MQZ8_ORCCI|nr:hypothetical protein Ocin01_11215 [Orchesella cincta]
MIFLAIRVVLCSVISALLIYGVKKERLPFIAANVIFYIIDLLLQTVYGLTRLNHNRHGFAGAVIPFLPTFITGYLIYVIFQAYVETLDGLTLRATRNAQMYQL